MFRYKLIVFTVFFNIKMLAREIEELIAACLDTEPYLCNIAEPDKLPFSLLNDREEYIRCAEILTALFVAFVFAGGEFFFQECLRLRSLFRTCLEIASGLCPSQ